MKDPIKDIIKRAAKRGMTLSRLFTESDLHRQVATHWQTRPPVHLVKYLKMLDELDLEVDITQTTWQQMGSRAYKVFLSEGFQKRQIETVWSKRDSEVVQTYKKLLKTLEYYENNNLTFKRRSAGRPFGSPEQSPS